MIKPLLENLRILICRPEPAASELQTVLQSVGAEVERLPCLEILPQDISEAGKQVILNLDQFEHIIVVSQHAGTLATELIDTYWPQMPVNQTWFAIGRKTAEAIEDMDITLARPSEDLTSESLLETPKLQNIKGKKILILKGMGGRSTIENTLGNRGAKVSTLELYERVCPDYDLDILQQKLSNFAPDFLITLSAETVLNLVKLSKSANIDINDYKLIVSSHRVADIAKEQGFQFTFVADNLLPIDIIRCIAKANKKKH